MIILRTYAGAGIALLFVLALFLLAGCSGEPNYTMNWTAEDGLEHYR